MEKRFSAILSVLFFAMLFFGFTDTPRQAEVDRDNLTGIGETESSGPRQKEKTETVAYSYQYTNMKLELPTDWAYNILAGNVDESADNFGIQFWPQAQPSMKISLRYHVNGIGLCGTGVTFEDISFQNGLTATKCTEGSDDNYWFFLIYHDVPGAYAVECSASKSLWAAYEHAIMSILESVEIGKNILSETEAIEAAKAECTVSYDTIRAYFDHTVGVWKIRFSTSDEADGDLTIRMDIQGELQSIIWGE